MKCVQYQWAILTPSTSSCKDGARRRVPWKNMQDRFTVEGRASVSKDFLCSLQLAITYETCLGHKWTLQSTGETLKSGVASNRCKISGEQQSNVHHKLLHTKCSDVAPAFMWTHVGAGQTWRRAERRRRRCVGGGGGGGDEWSFDD